MQNNFVKKHIVLNVVIIVSFYFISASLSCKKDDPYVIKNPESVVWNPVTNTYLISNAGSGKILALKDKKEFDVFNKSKLNSPKGMTILNKTVYVTDVTQVVGFNLADGKEVFRLDIPGAVFLNDITVGPDSMLFVSDMKGNSIVRLDSASKKCHLFKSLYLRNPNGLFYQRLDGQDMLYIVSFRASAPVLTLNLKTSEFKPIPNTEVSMADGITLDAEGSWLISSWQDNTIHKFKPDWSARTHLNEKLTTPADLYLNKLNNELCIPQFNSNQISFVTPLEKKPETSEKK